MELQLQTAVEIVPQGTISRFTRWVLHDSLVWLNLSY